MQGRRNRKRTVATPALKPFNDVGHLGCIHYSNLTNQLAYTTPPFTCSVLLLLFTTIDTVRKHMIKLILVREIAMPHR